MVQYIQKSVVVAEIDRRIEHNTEWKNACKTFAVLAANQAIEEDKKILSIINNLEVVDPYEQHIQYASIESGIKAHAEDYSFNIESKLFNQLTKEQQVIWRKEIEQACISGGYDGVELARDPRYKENLEVKEVDLENDVRQIIDLYLEAGKYYDDVIRKERNMYGYSDLAIKLLDRTADANEMSIQYVLDKLKAQKEE